VLDESGRPIGVVSLRDLVDGDGAGPTVLDRMSRPAITVTLSASVEQAARQLASMDMHHIVVVDGAGSAAGMISTLDALRALLDLPARHPPTFPHWDESMEVSWTDEWPLDVDAMARVAAGPGVIALVTGRLGERDAIVWVESSGSLPGRLRRLVTAPEDEEPPLRKVLSQPGIRFRAALVPDEAARVRIVGILRQRIETAPAPGAT
jgi:CBS domain-containing protein